jgi:DNA-binding IclR family transcriptional regulator
MSQQSGSLRIKSVDKALRILESFKDRKRELSLTEIVELTGIEKSAAQRATYTLRESGSLAQNADTRRYSLGQRVLDLSYHYLRNDPLLERAAPVLMELRRAAKERVDLSIIDGVMLQYILRLPSKQEALFTPLPGRRVPMFCTAGGRAILSLMSEEDAAWIIQNSDRKCLTEFTITDIPSILERVRLARRQGYSMQIQECLPGEIVIGAAILDEDARPIAAIHIAGLLGEWEPKNFETRMAPLLSTAARRLSR